MTPPFTMKVWIALLLASAAPTAAAFHPRVPKFTPVSLRVSQGGQEMAAPIPSSFDPYAFDGFDENWSTSFNNPIVMAAYGRYLETGQMDTFLEQVMAARLRRMKKQVIQPDELVKEHYPDLPPNLTEDDRRQQLWLEGERRRQLELEQRMKKEPQPRKHKSARFQGPQKPEPALSDPRNLIQQAPRVPPVVPPQRPY